MSSPAAVRGLRRAELTTREPADAVQFYESLLDWTVLPDDAGLGCWVGDRRSAAIRPSPSAQSAGWRLVFAGAGEDGLLTGPDDTVATLMKGRAQHGPWAPGPRLGEPCWLELLAGDGARADDFWGGSLGWTPEAAEASATYLRAGRPIASRRSVSQPGGQLGWLCYFAVDDLDSAAARAENAGGSVVEKVHHDRLGDSLVVADPSGALVGLALVPGSWGA